jgi:hypothetical protein
MHSLQGSENKRSPAWSPDGAHLAFSLSPVDDSGHRTQELHLTTLAESGDGTLGVEDNRIVLDSDTFGAHFSNLSFSKTQNSIYFSSGPQGAIQIWALHLDDEMNPFGPPHVLFDTHSPGGVMGISASAGGGTIGFAANDPNAQTSSIFTANSDGTGGVTLICSNGSWPSFKR